LFLVLGPLSSPPALPCPFSRSVLAARRRTLTRKRRPSFFRARRRSRLHAHRRRTRDRARRGPSRLVASRTRRVGRPRSYAQPAVSRIQRCVRPSLGGDRSTEPPRFTQISVFGRGRLRVVIDGSSSCVLPVSDIFAPMPSEAPIRANNYEVKTCGKDWPPLRIRIRIHPLLFIPIKPILSCAGAGRCVLPALPAARSR
jgi:hypothetical protein